MYVRGPITHCGLAARDAVFIRVRTPNLTSTLRHPTGWLISNFLFWQEDIIFLSQCLLLWSTLHKWYSHAPQPCAPTVDHQPTIWTQIQQACLLFFTNNFHPGAYTLLQQTHTFWLWMDRIEHIRKGHLRHGHQQLVYILQRDHKPTSHKWMYYPHTSIEILARFF